jgi:hypothetical protein
MSTLIYQALEVHDRYGYIPMWQCVELAEKRRSAPRMREGQARRGPASPPRPRGRSARRAGALRAWLL